MSQFSRVLACAGVMLISAGVIPYVHAHQLQAVEGNGPYRRPQRMEHLGYLTHGLYDKGLNRAQWTEVLLTWLVEERNDPTPTHAGGGGGQIDSGYMQAQLIKALADEGSPDVLDFLSASRNLKDEDVRDAMRLALARAGDKRQAFALRHILGHHQEPYFRALAAGGLQDIADIDAMPLLQTALHDDFSVHAENDMRGAYTSYPVREAAAEALAAMRKVGFAGLAQDRSHKFAICLGDERKYAAVPKASLVRLLAIANLSKRTTIARKQSKR